MPQIVLPVGGLRATPKSDKVVPPAEPAQQDFRSLLRKSGTQPPQ